MMISEIQYIKPFGVFVFIVLVLWLIFTDLVHLRHIYLPYFSRKMLNGQSQQLYSTWGQDPLLCHAGPFKVLILKLKLISMDILQLAKKQFVCVSLRIMCSYLDLDAHISTQVYLRA